MCGKGYRAENCGREFHNTWKPGNAAAEKIQKPDAHLTLGRHLLIFQSHEQTQVCPHMIIFWLKMLFFFFFLAAGPLITNCILIYDANLPF